MFSPLVLSVAAPARRLHAPFQHSPLHPLAYAVGALLVSANMSSAWAQTVHAVPPEQQLQEVVVTANPFGHSVSELITPVQTLRGEALTLRQASTLGATLDGLPGVAASQFGPNASRPVIRGMDGDRVRILQNGAASLDAASLSPDHATPIEPLLAESIEVVRGPATLLYGANALGGAVNVVSNQIPQDKIQGVQGRAETRLGGAERERAAVAMVEAGNGQWALHADVSARKTSDLRIPGYARSAALRASDPKSEETYGTLPNSWAQQESGSVGAAYTGDKVRFGLSYQGWRGDYGTVAEPTVRIKMQQEHYGLEGEVRDLSAATAGWLDKLTTQAHFSDYEHRELESGEIGTTFKNRGWEARLEAHQAKRGNWEGLLGVQAQGFRFSALGDEAFVPSTQTQNLAAFTLQEWHPTPRINLSLGGRVEHVNLKAEADDAGKFAADQRSFNGYNGALGLRYTVLPGLNLTSQLAYTQRLPTFYELYADGKHIATNAYELGSRTLGKEKATTLDAGVRWKSSQSGVGLLQANLQAYYSQIDDFISLQNTGQFRDDTRAIVPAGTPDSVAEYAYQAVPAKLWGAEAEATVRVAQGLFGVGKLDWTVRGDMVRGSRRDSGEALPRMAPWRVGNSLAYQHGAWRAQVEVLYHASQNRVPHGESTTAAYTLLNLALNYAWRWQGLSGQVFVKGENLTNTEARQATSFLRDVAPLGGRAVRAGLRVNF